jgi:hypothetical protein
MSPTNAAAVAASDPADVVAQMERHAGHVQVSPAPTSVVVAAPDLAVTAGAPGDAMGRPDIDHQAGRVELDTDDDGRFQPDELSE